MSGNNSNFQQNWSVRINVTICGWFVQFSYSVNKIEKIVADGINEDLKVPEIEYDAVIDIDDVSPKMLRILGQMEPFGPGNMKPIFRTNDIQDTGFAKVLKEKHLKISTKNKRQRIDAIGFGMAHVYNKVTQGKPFNACYTIEENEYNGQKNIQLNLKDIK